MPIFIRNSIINSGQLKNLWLLPVLILFPYLGNCHFLHTKHSNQRWRRPPLTKSSTGRYAARVQTHKVDETIHNKLCMRTEVNDGYYDLLMKQGFCRISV